MVKYLREVFARLSTDVIKKPNVYPSTYVFGHTHRAVNRTQLSLGDMKSGPVDIEYINTGAFQRIVSKEQLEKLLVAPAGGQARSLSSLTPNDLPACYTFVAVEPYSVAPKANLMSWVEGSSGKFAAGSGGCW